MIVDRRAEPDRAGDVGRAGLEAVRRLLELGLLEGDVEDHVAAALPGRHRRRAARSGLQHADAGRPIGLVAGEDVEVAAERLHIDRQPRRRLAAVDQHLGAVPRARDDDPVSTGTSAPVALARWVIATSRVRGDSSAPRTRPCRARRSRRSAPPRA